MSLEDELVELSNVYHASREHVEELEAGMVDCNKKIAGLQEIADVLFEIAPAGQVKSSLWRKYRNIVTRKEIHGN